MSISFLSSTKGKFNRRRSPFYVFSIALCFISCSEFCKFSYSKLLQYLQQKKYVQSSVSRVNSDVYFNTHFEESYDKFESNFKVYAYDVKKFAPKLDYIYGMIKKMEKKEGFIQTRNQVSDKKQNLPLLDLHGQYALEFWFDSWLRSSAFSTLNLDEATAFFVNTKCTALRKTQQKRLPAQRVTQLYLKELIKNLSTEAKEKNFLDHFYVCSHDMGIESMRSAPLNFRTNAIGVVHTADFLGEDANNVTWNKFKDVMPELQGGLVFNAHRDLTALPFINLKVEKNTKSFKSCRLLAMFLGSINGRSPRQKIFSLFRNNSDFLLGTAFGKEYQRSFQISKFCLIIRGYVTSTLRFSEAFLYSCIPVIISDGYVPPFSSSIDWSSFSIFIPERDIIEIPRILGSITEEEWDRMNINLQKVRKHFLYNNPPERGDAFHMVLYEIWKKTYKLKNW